MSDKEHLQLIDDLVDVLYADKIEIREFVRKTLLKDNTIDSMAHIIKLKNKEMRELSNFLKERNITLIDLSPLVTVMDHVQELECKEERNVSKIREFNVRNSKLEQQNKKYHEAIKISIHELFVRNAYENDEAINEVMKILGEALEEISDV